MIPRPVSTAGGDSTKELYRKYVAPADQRPRQAVPWPRWRYSALTVQMDGKHYLRLNRTTPNIPYEQRPHDLK